MKDGEVSTEAWVIMKWEGNEVSIRVVKSLESGRGACCICAEMGRLSHAMVLGAGHTVPVDQPLSSQAMIENCVWE